MPNYIVIRTETVPAADAQVPVQAVWHISAASPSAAANQVAAHLGAREPQRLFIGLTSALSAYITTPAAPSFSSVAE